MRKLWCSCKTSLHQLREEISSPVNAHLVSSTNISSHSLPVSCARMREGDTTALLVWRRICCTKIGGILASNFQICFLVPVRFRSTALAFIPLLCHVSRLRKGWNELTASFLRKIKAQPTNNKHRNMNNWKALSSVLNKLLWLWILVCLGTHLAMRFTELKNVCTMRCNCLSCYPALIIDVPPWVPEVWSRGKIT